MATHENRPAHNGTLASAYATEANTFTKIVAGFTVPVRLAFHEGDTLTALQARALSNYLLERGASVANSNIDRGQWKDMSDADKLAKVSAYLAGEYKFSDDIGSDVFGYSLLQRACTRIIAKLNAEKCAGMDEPALLKALAPAVVRFINDPAVGEKYGADVRAEMDAILATRVAKRERTAKPSDAASEMAW